MVTALPVFDAVQLSRARTLLATQIAYMMGRKYEEGDWADVYETAKGMPRSTWSNLAIDVMCGNLGVEHKMMCRPEEKSILDACGTTLMHPAGTRAIRIPNIEDPTLAARDILRQYCELIDHRTETVRILHQYAHSQLTKSEALEPDSKVRQA